MICGRKGLAYKRQSALRSSRGSHTETTNSTGLLTLPCAGAWRPPTESPTESRGPEAWQELGTILWPPGLMFASLGQALLGRSVVGDLAANRQGQDGKKTAPGRRTLRKTPRSSQSYKATQQRHGHHPRSATGPPQAHRSQHITQRKPSSSSSPSCPQASCVCATSTFKALFLFLNLALHFTGSQQLPQPAPAPRWVRPPRWALETVQKVLNQAQVCLSPPEDSILHVPDEASHRSSLVPNPKSRARILLSFYPS